MKRSDLITKMELKDMESSFGKFFQMKIGDKYIATDLFAVRGFSTMPSNSIANLIDNVRYLCNVIEANYE